MAIAWVITGIGMFFIANTFRTLASARPDLTAGIYMYGKDGFGEYAGFTIAWGYWLCQVCGNVGYAVITMDALNYFFPGWFAGGNNWESIVGGSLLIWIFNFVVLSGVKQASLVNTIATVCKLLPIALFIVVLFFVFNWDKFTFDIWGNLTSHGEKNLGGLGAQIKGTMLVTLWAFIGIEGAVVLSGRAKSQKDVGGRRLRLHLRTGDFRPALDSPVRLHDPSAARRRAESLDGGNTRKHRRRMGQLGDERRAYNLGARKLAGVDDDYRRNALRRRKGRHVPEDIRAREQKRLAERVALDNKRAHAACRCCLCTSRTTRGTQCSALRA